MVGTKEEDVNGWEATVVTLRLEQWWLSLQYSKGRMGDSWTYSGNALMVQSMGLLSWLGYRW